MTRTAIAVLAGAFAVSAVGTLAFRAFAIRRGIVANPNFRTLHQGPKPRAGGIVFASVFLAIAAVMFRGVPDDPLTRAMLWGGAGATLFGFLDDIVDIGARIKLLVQAALAAWIVFCFNGSPYDLPWTPALVDAGIAWFALLWLMNVYNFVDGVDGMAASGAVFIAVAAVTALYLRQAEHPLAFLLLVLAACAAGFLLFNRPPARIFMGDAGSLFLGYTFGVFIVASVSAQLLSVWTWVVVFGYFAGDTGTTTVLRIFLTDHWYGEHRSHAYQNLARILDSHAIVVGGVTLYHVLWLLPLTVWSALVPSMAPVAAILALLPPVAWTLRYGPLLSSS